MYKESRLLRWATIQKCLHFRFGFWDDGAKNRYSAHPTAFGCSDHACSTNARSPKQTGSEDRRKNDCPRTICYPYSTILTLSIFSNPSVHINYHSSFRHSAKTGVATGRGSTVSSAVLDFDIPVESVGLPAIAETGESTSIRLLWFSTTTAKPKVFFIEA